MANNNQIVLIGNVCNTLKVEYVSDSCFVKVTISCPRYGNINDDVVCKFWDRQAEILEEYVKQGDLLSVTGSLRVEEDSFYIQGEAFQMLRKKQTTAV